MDNKAFLAEICDYIDQSYHEFETYQELAFEILCEVDRICRDSEIRYFLAFGTLLGAIRDKGQIPWDYDVDVQIFIDDKDRFIKALRTKLGSEYYYAYIDNTHHYPAWCIRVCKKGHHFNAIHVDVFFIIGCPSDELSRKRFMVTIKKHCDKQLAKYSRYWFEPQCGRLETVKQVYNRLRTLFVSERSLQQERDKLCSIYPLSSSEYCCVLTNIINVYKSEWYSAVDEIEINGVSFSVPVGWDNLLTTMYSNYSEYQSIEERFKEFYGLLGIIQQRDKYV